MGQLFSLQNLNLSHNHLASITQGGLSGCDKLVELNVSHNHITGVANVEHLALLPALQTLRMSDNPVAQDKHYR